jgi:hypothetical protein
MTLIRYENPQGGTIFPYNVDYERDIVLGFIGRTLAFPVTAVTVIIGSAYRDIVITGYNMAYQTKILKLRNVYQLYGAEIERLIYDNYSDPYLKEMHRNELIQAMKDAYDQIRNS